MDKISKALNKLSPQEKKKLKVILNKIKLEKFDGLDVRKLKGHDNIYRVRKGKMRIMFLKNEKKISIIALERRGDNTYDI